MEGCDTEEGLAGPRLRLGKGRSGFCRALQEPWKAPAELQVGLGAGHFLYVFLGEDGAVCLSRRIWRRGAEVSSAHFTLECVEGIRQ